MSYILVIFIWAGAWAKGNDATMFSIPGFASAEECERAASSLPSLVNGTQQDVRHLCLAQGEKKK